MVTYFMVLSFPLALLILYVLLTNVIKTLRGNYASKKIIQYIVYVMEIYMAIYIGISFISFIENGNFIFWESGENFFTYFQRGLASYTTYSILVISMLKLSASSDQDGNLAYKKLLKVILYRLENNEYGGRLLPLMPSFLPPFADKCTTLCGAFYHFQKTGETSIFVVSPVFHYCFYKRALLSSCSFSC
ncbi:hypothetical protein [Salibacterium qingdaonense]|uniref:Uncharacterized protein n=1 Tax=Salibacterium qingdaonense TaxID=266892 RepID=A0A1I4QMQ4_9BACI|nr:hypothetical protein [Salibacterium qingdaonense]SFM41327.1 hypothetical protein SAMN04488054_14518 [Salibacterium qingdaonense]